VARRDPSNWPRLTTVRKRSRALALAATWLSGTLGRSGQAIGDNDERSVADYSGTGITSGTPLAALYG
jgi:hypothetical protein